MPHANEICLAILFVLVVLSFVLKDKARAIARQTLLVGATLTVVGFYASVLTGSTGNMAALKSNTQAEKAELPLKFQSTLNVGVARIYQSFAPIEDSHGQKKDAMELHTTGMQSMMKSAAKILKAASASSTQPQLVKAKLAVVTGTGDLEKPEALKKIIDEVGAKKELEPLAAALTAAFIDHSVPADHLDEFVATIKKQLPVGWYQDNALLALYRAGDKKEAASFSKHLEDVYWRSFTRFSCGIVIAIGALFVGFVALAIQIGSLAGGRGLRKKRNEAGELVTVQADATPESELPALSVDLKTVFSVFVAWQATEVALAYLLRLLPKGALALSHDANGVAFFVLLSYLINMLPAVLYIYFLALKPRGLSFIGALKIRYRTLTAGPFRLALTGFFAWCSAIPLVIIAFLLASSFIGAEGSDNPILAQIISAATTSNMVAVSLLFFTVAILAPIFEEIIFRGFLYAALRNRIGIFPSILISSFVFGAIHLDKGGLAMLFAIGIALAMCFERSRSLLACMFAHGLWNGGTLLLNLSLMSNS